MDNIDDLKRQLEQYRYRAQIAEAENVAVKGSKAYRIIKLIGSMKADFKKNPVGLTKKAARILLTQPAKILSKGKNREIVTQSVIDQTNKYQEWILLNEPKQEELNTQYAASEAFSYKPLISIITPVFNPPAKVLEELIESVLVQTYPYFELCLGDFGDNQEVSEMLERYSKLDNRVKNWKFTDNKGISGNSNAILEKISGDYIGLLDHDDTLSPDALYENVKALNEKRYDFIYSDKDKIDEKNNRFDPLFKPKFSPEMLLNINYLTHFNVMSTQLVKQVGAWDPTTDGAQDWDLFLKIVANAKSIHHIPKVLYHWRVIASSTALSIETKPYALAGQRRAVDKYLEYIGIPGKSTHHKTELFINWDKKAVPDSPLVIVSSSSVVRTKHLIRKVIESAPRAQFIVMDDSYPNEIYNKSVIGQIPSSGHSLSAISRVIGKTDISLASKTIVFIDDTLEPARDWYEKLVGWLSVPGVGVVGGRVIDKHDMVIDSGGVVTDGKYQPIFNGYPKYYQGYIGNAEWVRDLSMLSGIYCATNGKHLSQFLKSNSEKNTAASIYDYFAWLSTQEVRIVMTPQSSVITVNPRHIQERLGSIQLTSSSTGIDEFSNHNVSKKNPMVLLDEEDVSESLSSITSKNTYQNDAIILATSYDISEQEIVKCIKNNSQPIKGTPQSAAFVLPSFDAIYAGLMNIFSFAEYLQTKQHMKITFYVLKDARDTSAEKKMVAEKVPALNAAKFVVMNEQQVSKIENHDIGIATLWSTAYVLAKCNTVAKKYYFIQDNETNFYPKGTISALVELTYRFGFYVIANTDGLLNLYKKSYGGEGTVLQSKVDLTDYYPKKEILEMPRAPYKVFFYARPNMPRNAFELGVAGLKKLKAKMGDEVEIITAGAEWNPLDYGVAGMFTNLGKISYDAVPVLYRSVDVGLMFMFSGHPGVTASELMASGCPVVVNEYDDITWNDLYQHEKTCLISKATASEVARNLERCLTDETLRNKLIQQGLAKSLAFYGDYDAQLDRAYKNILKHYNG